MDVLVKTLTGIPHLVSWKIEGRKKGPHYVYHTVTAYRILRDNPGDPEAKKTAEGILQMALGRPNTRARFLPQHTAVPVDPSGQTSSGLLVGKIGIDRQGAPFTPRCPYRASRPRAARSSCAFPDTRLPKQAYASTSLTGVKRNSRRFSTNGRAASSACPSGPPKT